jgi:hypothetical protein
MPVRAVALLALAACDPAATSGAPAAPTDATDLSCTALSDMSEAALRAAHGEDNVVEQTLFGVEGETYSATVLYPDDPRRRLEIVWQDQAAKTWPANISVGGENSVWTGPNGLSIGDELARVEQLNGRPFKLWGFSWDYGGWVSDWNGGAFAAAEGSCTTGVRFEATGNGDNADGDGEFQSDSEEMRAAKPRIVALALVFPTRE